MSVWKRLFPKAYFTKCGGIVLKDALPKEVIVPETAYHTPCTCTKIGDYFVTPSGKYKLSACAGCEKHNPKKEKTKLSSFSQAHDDELLEELQKIQFTKGFSTLKLLRNQILKQVKGTTEFKMYIRQGETIYNINSFDSLKLNDENITIVKGREETHLQFKSPQNASQAFELLLSYLAKKVHCATVLEFENGTVSLVEDE